MKSVGQPMDSPMITFIELKLDEETLFKWQTHTLSKVSEFPDHETLPRFLDGRARASDS